MRRIVYEHPVFLVCRLLIVSYVKQRITHCIDNKNSLHGLETLGFFFFCSLFLPCLPIMAKDVGYPNHGKRRWTQSRFEIIELSLKWDDARIVV